MQRMHRFGLAGCLCIASAFAQDFPSAEQIAKQRENLPAAIRTPEFGEPLTAARPTRARLSMLSSPTVPDSKKLGPITLLGQAVQPGTTRRLNWSSGPMFAGGAMGAPVIVIHGKQPGPVLCLTGAIHGDELNGVEVINRFARKLKASDLAGTVIAVPVVNIPGFSRSSRYLPDRRDLNRFFPGSPNGSAASRLAFDFFHSVVQACDYLVDFHTGSFERSNLPQVRGDLRIREVIELGRAFGATTVLHSPGTPGMLRVAATNIGIPAVTFELGAPIRLEPKEIAFGEAAVETLLDKLGMVNRLRVWNKPQPVFYDSKWVRVSSNGMLFSAVELGSKVIPGQLLGTVIDPLSGTEMEVRSPARGRVIGMALNQIVLPGFAAYHLGYATSEAEAVRKALVLRKRPVAELESDSETEESDAQIEASPHAQ